MRSSPSPHEGHSMSDALGSPAVVDASPPHEGDRAVSVRDIYVRRCAPFSAGSGQRQNAVLERNVVPRLTVAVHCPRWLWGGGGGGDVLEERRGWGGGRGDGTQKCMHQKWPKSIFPFVNFFFCHQEIWVRGGGSNGGGGDPPPMVVSRSNTSLGGWGGGKCGGIKGCSVRWVDGHEQPAGAAVPPLDVPHRAHTSQVRRTRLVLRNVRTGHCECGLLGRLGAKLGSVPFLTTAEALLGIGAGGDEVIVAVAVDALDTPKARWWGVAAGNSHEHRGRTGGGGLAQSLGTGLFAFGGAYWPLATAHSDPLWVRTCFGCVNRAPG